ncbi:MAG TPA: 3'(2'),5'-bisphosphate nucleotidase CysQ [Candidatus Saccharimonadales bacterium]|nr:3'(2'),5'-bisphosphate nucleotidase CysQ [Candidatus Saccharimonadales bacterium]
MASILHERLDDVLGVVYEAELAIMELYGADGLKVYGKADNTPVTQADLAAHRILSEGLLELSGIPVLSEEGDPDENAEIAGSDHFIALDPIDNTRGFIGHLGEFMVGVCEVRDGIPVWGVASAPAEGETYWGGPGLGSFKQEGGEEPRPIRVQADSPTGVVMVSHRQGSASPTAAYIERHYPDHLLSQAGSYLKFTQVAEGRADAYPRAGNGMQVWDVTPGHAIVTGAGGKVTSTTGSGIDYREWSPYWSNFVASGGAIPVGAGGV